MPMFEKPHATFSGKMALFFFIFFFCKGFSFQIFFQKSFFFGTSPPPFLKFNEIQQKFNKNSTKFNENSTKINEKIQQNSTKFNKNSTKIQQIKVFKN